jgi:glucose-1-phosphate adenylyltransferase
VLLPGAQIGRGARLTRVVVDRACVIPDGMVIGEDAELDAQRFHRSENGITLVTRDMLAKLNA